MKYNPVTNTIDRPDGTPYLHLAPCIGAQEAYQIADTLLQAPEWEKEREELEAQIEDLKGRLVMEEDAATKARDEQDATQSELERVSDDLDAARAWIEDLKSDLNDTGTELTQAHLRIEELEAMLAACEAARESELREPV